MAAPAFQLSPNVTIPRHALVRDESRSDCFFGTIPCLDGSQVCINPFKYLGCTFDAISPIKLDDLAQVMVGIFDEMRDDAVAFVNDPVQFVADFTVDTINDFFTDAKNCWKGISGKPTDCSQLGTVRSCMSTALAAVGGGSSAGVKALKAAEKTRAIKALGKAQDFLDKTNALCTPVVTLKYETPEGCTCRRMEYSGVDPLYGKISGVTPLDCATNTAIFSSVKHILVDKVEFTYMGCYVGQRDDYGSYKDCNAAYPSIIFKGAMFARCVDQYDRTLNLDTHKSEPANPDNDTPSPANVNARPNATSARPSTFYTMALIGIMTAIISFHLVWEPRRQERYRSQ